MELDPENTVPVQLAIAYFDEALRAMLPVFFETYLEGEDRVTRVDVLNRFSRALSSERVRKARREVTEREAANLREQRAAATRARAPRVRRGR